MTKEELRTDKIITVRFVKSVCEKAEKVIGSPVFSSKKIVENLVDSDNLVNIQFSTVTADAKEAKFSIVLEGVNVSTKEIYGKYKLTVEVGDRSEELDTGKFYYVPDSSSPILVYPTDLSHERVVITGTLSRPRRVYQDIIKQHGGVYQSSVRGTTSFLIHGAISRSAKLTRAKELGTSVISERVFNLLY